MSIKIMDRVWEHSHQKGSALLLLLAIADHAHDDGTGAWPSVLTLSKKTRMTRRNVQLLIRKVEQSGELKVLTGEGPHGCNAYSIHLAPSTKEQPRGVKITQVKRAARGMKRSAAGVKSSAFPSGEAGFTRTINRHKPSENRQYAPSNGRHGSRRLDEPLQPSFSGEFIEKMKASKR